LLASGAAPAALADTSTRLSTNVAFGESCAASRNEIVPLTSFAGAAGAAAAVAAVAVAAAVDAGAPASVCCEGEELLQPDIATAATDISDKTILRMGKPLQT
jgi:hypothetical protein